MTEKRKVTVILGLYVALAIAYSGLIPPWEGPDEPAHYILAVNLARVGRFSSIERNYEAGQPQTYYRLASIPLRGLYLLKPDWVAVVRPQAHYDNIRQPAPVYAWSEENYQFLPGLYLLRWLNIVMGAGALLLNYAAMKNFVLARDKLNPSSFHETSKHPSLASLSPKHSSFPSVPLIALVLIALIPQYLHTTSTVSNDTLGILAGAFLFWATSKLMFTEIGLWRMGVILVTAFLFSYGTKLTVLPVGLAVVIVVMYSARKRNPTQWKWMMGSGVVLGFGLILVINQFLPEMGRLFLRQIDLRLLGIKEESLNSEYLWEMVSQVVWSFWGKVGWLAVGLPGWVVVLLTGLGVAGGAAEGMRRREAGGQKLSWVVWFVAGLALAAVLKNGLSTVNSQGRFLFPAVGVLALLMVSGWWSLIGRARPFLWMIVTGVMVGVNLILWVWGVIPVYYQPWLD